MSSASPPSELIRQRLTDLREGLLVLHRALLNSERICYEREHGRIPSSGQFFHLVLNHGWFAWLRPVSGLVAEIDAMLDAEDPATASDMTRVFKEARTLLRPSEHSTGFGKWYFDAIQRDPDVVLAHAKVTRLLA
jgi:hypothetical protein